MVGEARAWREATERNLREGAAFPGAVAFKAPERRRIAGQGYTIVLSLGDQASDLRGGYAERTFKPPNPVYDLP